MGTPCLIYVTTSFPYGMNDVFPADELPFLLDSFSRVVLAPRVVTENISYEQIERLVSLSPVLSASKWAKVPFLASMAAVRLFIREYASYKHCAIKPRLSPLLRAIGIALHAKSVLRGFLVRQKLVKTPVVIYSYWFNEAVLGFGMLREEFPQLRVVTRAHGGDLYPERSPYGYLPFRFQRTRAVDMLCPCSENGAVFLRHEGFPSDKVMVARLGVPPGKNICPPSPEGHLALVSCSSADPVKRLPLLVDSLRDLALHRPDLRISWRHMGGGEGWEAFRARADAALMPLPNVRYTLHGHLPVKEVRAFLAAHPLDGLINVSSSEGIPVSMMEALAVGLPVLATRVGGVHELVTQHTGILIPKDFSPEQFRNAAESLLQWKSFETRQLIFDFFTRNYFQDANYKKFVSEALVPQMEISRSIVRTVLD
ncbi:MAG: glycosyltransferase [Desulfovibrionaceae bacterium]|nr:glycosyltransferase [Desulfovibrionaceae bacterium]